MAPIGGQYFSNTKTGYAYIPAVALAYVYSLNQNTQYLIVGAVALASAVFTHGLLQSIHGPDDANSGPLSRSKKVKRLLAAIWDHAGEEYYPADLKDGLTNSRYRRPSRYYVLALMVTSAAVILLGYSLSIVYLTQNIAQLNYVGVTLFFVLLLWPLQLFLWKPWRSVYLKEQRLQDRPDHGELATNEMERTAFFVQEETVLNPTHTSYKPVDGGKFHIEFTTKNTPCQVPADTFDTIAQAYIAFLDRVDMPIQRMEGFIKYHETYAERFKVETDWVKEYQRRDIDYDSFQGKFRATFDIGDFSKSNEADNQ